MSSSDLDGVYFILLLEKISGEEIYCWKIGPNFRTRISISEVLSFLGSLPKVSYTCNDWRRSIWFLRLPTSVVRAEDEWIDSFNKDDSPFKWFLSPQKAFQVVGISYLAFSNFPNEEAGHSCTGAPPNWTSMVLVYGKWTFTLVVGTKPGEVEISDGLKSLPFSSFLPE